MDKVTSSQAPETQDVSTSDIVLAAFLRAKGVPLERIEKNGNRGIFVFHQVNVAMLEAFDLGQALVEPIQFNGHIKSLTTATRRIV